MAMPEPKTPPATAQHPGIHAAPRAAHPDRATRATASCHRGPGFPRRPRRCRGPDRPDLDQRLPRDRCRTFQPGASRWKPPPPARQPCWPTRSAARCSRIDQTLRVLKAAFQADPEHFNIQTWREQIPVLTDVADDVFIADEHLVIQQDMLPTAVGMGIGNRFYADFGQGQVQTCQDRLDADRFDRARHVKPLRADIPSDPPGPSRRMGGRRVLPHQCGDPALRRSARWACRA